MRAKRGYGILTQEMKIEIRTEKTFPTKGERLINQETGKKKEVVQSTGFRNKEQRPVSIDSLFGEYGIWTLRFCISSTHISNQKHYK